jgi:thioredoxin-like negative regulator of GroEL
MLSYLHQYAEAELEYRKLLKLHPHSLPIRLNLARTLYYQSKNDEALNLLEQIPLHQRGEEVKVLLADIHLSLQHYNEAESLYREYLQQYPEDQTSQLNLAKVLSWQKKYEPSVEIYRHLLSNDPDNIQIRRQYGRVLIWMGKYSEGTEELKKTLIQEKNIP